MGEAKAMGETLKRVLIKRIDEIVAEKNSHDNGYHYRAVVNEWENYGLSRTYFQIIETRDHSTHRAIAQYGYYDDLKKEYVPHKYNKLVQ